MTKCVTIITKGERTDRPKRVKNLSGNCPYVQPYYSPISNYPSIFPHTQPAVHPSVHPFSDPYSQSVLPSTPSSIYSHIHSDLLIISSLFSLWLNITHSVSPCWRSSFCLVGYWAPPSISHCPLSSDPGDWSSISDATWSFQVMTNCRNYQWNFTITHL